MADTPEKRDALLSNPAIVAVLEIIDDALSSPSAYVEPALFRNRLAVKATENVNSLGEAGSAREEST